MVLKFEDPRVEIASRNFLLPKAHYVRFFNDLKRKKPARDVACYFKYVGDKEEAGQLLQGCGRGYILI